MREITRREEEEKETLMIFTWFFLEFVRKLDGNGRKMREYVRGEERATKMRKEEEQEAVGNEGNKYEKKGRSREEREGIKGD